MSTLTASTTSLRRHPSWYAPLLLPLLPLIARSLPSPFWRSTPPANGAEALLWLGILGVVLTWGVPDLVDRLGWCVRKEAEQLRPFWLASLFLVQVPLITIGQGPTAVWVFAGLGALLASVPFGLEFQQRTLSGLLSLPVGRRELWLAKMGTLGGALLSLWAVGALSILASERWLPVGDLVPNLGLFLLAALMFWGTTPYWTLITRGLMSGLVFSLAVPLIPGFVVLLAGSLGDSTGTADAKWLDSPALGVGVGVLFLGYAVAGVALGRRAWARLEAPDLVEGSAFGPWEGRHRAGSARAVAGGRRSRWVWLVGKELRLQWVTLVVLGLLMATAAGFRFVSPQWGGHVYLEGTVFLFAGAAILLAGSTAVAEERRLGTLDGQLLLPVSRTAQWWLKVAVAATLGLLAWGIVLGTTRNLPITSGVVVAALPLALLASSGSANAVRALVASVVLVAATAVLVMVIPGLLGLAENRLTGSLDHAAFAEPEPWLERAKRLTESEALVLRGQVGEGSWQRLELIGRLLALPTLILPIAALWFAHGNFRLPAAAGRRLGRQSGLCLVLLIGAMAVWGLTHIGLQVRWQDRQNLYAAYRYLEIGRTLSPAERGLRSFSAGGPSIWVGRGIRLKISEAGQGGDASLSQRAEKRNFTLPLSPEDRQLIIDRAVIPDQLRAALRKEAAADGGR